MLSGRAVQRVASIAGNVERFQDHTSRGLGQRELREFRRCSPRNLRDVASRARLAAYRLAQIVENHVVVPRFALAIEIDALENLDQLEHRHLDAGFFEQLAAHTQQERFPRFEHAAGNRPLPFERRAAAPHQQRASIRNDDSADADHGTIRVFAITRHRYAIPLARFLATGVI